MRSFLWKSSRIRSFFKKGPFSHLRSEHIVSLSCTLDTVRTQLFLKLNQILIYIFLPVRILTHISENVQNIRMVMQVYPPPTVSFRWKEILCHSHSTEYIILAIWILIHIMLGWGKQFWTYSAYHPIKNFGRLNQCLSNSCSLRRGDLSD